MCMQTVAADPNYSKLLVRRSLRNEHGLGKHKKTGKEEAFLKYNCLVAYLASPKHFDG